jgi:Tol biopolymer transport system component
MVGPRGTNPRLIFRDQPRQAFGEPAFSPSGSRIAVGSGRRIEGGGFLGDILTARPDGGMLTLLLQGGQLEAGGEETFYDPTFSPNGREIAAQSLGGPTGGERVIAVDSRTGGNRRVLVEGGACCTGPQPTWSTTGLLAFTRVLQEPIDCGGGAPPELSDIYVAARGKPTRRLTRTYGSSAPDWSPDGKWLAFQRDSSLSRQDLQRAQVAAADQICRAPASARRFGNAARKPTTDVYAVRANGTGMRRIVADASQPAWAPDGRELAFVRNSWIYVRDMRTTATRRVARGGSPAWQPRSR